LEKKKMAAAKKEEAQAKLRDAGTAPQKEVLM
jgi:hypothetical protein